MKIIDELKTGNIFELANTSHIPIESIFSTKD
ncbi:Uncharacterised protein [Chryseobacterium gleum]|uniref:Uncharacterized protein n=1 Tax=Chryseobacterium gleum TaxID=250 RepID=A0A3S4MAF4_CHRGE|nr:Uncharacterised protein [Chryseobacterium gleum]